MPQGWGRRGGAVAEGMRWEVLVATVAGGGGGGGGVEAADLGEEAVDPALVAGEEHLHARALVALEGGGPHHLAPLAVHELVVPRVWAVVKGLARPLVVHLVSHLVPARERRRLAAHLHTHQGRAVSPTMH